MPRTRSRTHIRLWALMLAAFGLVGGCTTIAIVSISLSRYENDSRDELLTLSKAVALGLSPEQQLRLTRSDQTSYFRLNSILAKAQRQLGSVRRIFTVRKGRHGGYEDALDTSLDLAKPLPSRVLQPTLGLDRRAKSVFDSGAAEVDQEIVKDRMGPYFTAYAPLTDSTGHIVAVLGIDRDATQIAARVDAIKRATIIAISTALLLGAIFSLIIVRQLARGAQSEAWLRGTITSSRIFRATVLELILAALAMGVLGMGVQSQVRIGQLRVAENTSLDRSKALDQFRARIERELSERRADPPGLSILADAAAKGGYDWLSASLKVAATTKGPWQASLWQGLNGIKAKIEEERAVRQGIHGETMQMNERMTTALVLAILLSIGSLVLVRSAAKQQQELLIARHDSQRHQVAYEQVATNLPIGFYTYRDGDILDTNVMWDSMVTRQPGENRMMALERAVAEEDLGQFQHALTSTQESGGSFQIQFRIHTTSKQVRHFESRGLWASKSEEGIDHLLGFCVDVTDLVQVQEELEARNREVQAKNSMLSRALADLEENLEAMVHGLVKAVEAKDSYTAGHSERVMRYSVLIGDVLGLNPQQMRILERGTLIHDVGKIGIPDAVLNKPDRLSEEEFEIIKMHPSIGAQMVRGIPVFDDCIPIIQSHHERLDGKGYPDGLSGDQIPELVRIASVADVFDAVTSTRAYRGAMNVDQALSILRKDAEAGILDGRIVEVLADIVKREGVLWSSEPRKAA